jgi:hypothetical protein
MEGGAELFKSFTHEELTQARQTFDPFRTCPASLDTLTSSVPPAVKLAAASANLDILTPRCPARRPAGLPVSFFVPANSGLVEG